MSGGGFVDEKEAEGLGEGIITVAVMMIGERLTLETKLQINVFIGRLVLTTTIPNGHNRQMVYSEEELRALANAARKDAGYFRGLDWENASGKWGHVASPWRDHYPGCWEDLAKEVNAGVRHIYHDPKHIWTNTHFAAEFAEDNLEWPE
ncbi:unnamed protein product [Scytosiphon promiscuus]